MSCHAMSIDPHPQSTPVHQRERTEETRLFHRFHKKDVQK
jgi:hypothetical protein